MTKQRMWAVSCVVLYASAVWALDSDSRSQLKLVPAPKEVQLRDGGFQVGPRTKIFVQLGHQSEDRIAAETLAAGATVLQAAIWTFRAEPRKSD